MSDNYFCLNSGPCLLIERRATGRFFACSASRDRSDCNFFMCADDELSEERKKLWENITANKNCYFTHQKYIK